MTVGQQLSFLGLGSGLGKGYLFRADLLKRYINEHGPTRIPGYAEGAQAIKDWLVALSNTQASESSLEAMFITNIMCRVLGYVAHPNAGATLYHKPPTRLTGIKGTPDGGLGQFSADQTAFTAVLELKSPGTNFDAPQSSHGNRTTVEQAMDYGTQILAVKWVLVSDMRFIRLYSVYSDGEYEEFSLEDCVSPEGKPTEELRRLHVLLNHAFLIDGQDQSQVAKLYSKSADRQLEIRDGFYRAYYEIRKDLYEAIRVASAGLQPVPSRGELLEATQRLLDRLVFIYYCEHNPQRLIPRGTVQQVVDAARRRPGRNANKVYEDLKELFREVDAGSPPSSGLRLDGYNGELFKDHRIIDYISLPDSLASRPYFAIERGGSGRRIDGVWGLHAYDFWLELTEHLLGHVFEQSLSDLEDLGTAHQKSLEARLAERKRDGVFYTTSVLSDFLCASAVRAVLDERAPMPDLVDKNTTALHSRMAALHDLRVVDFACGSGAFLVSAYSELLREFVRLETALERTGQVSLDMFSLADIREHAALLRNGLYGVDKLPQATELAKLALWLRSAQKKEKVADLSRNILASDSLSKPIVFEQLGSPESVFDVVVGNPPWGGEIDDAVYNAATTWLGVEPNPTWDSWELFLLLGLRALKPGGRLALVLPDSFLYPEKSRLRRLLCEAATLEKVHRLGPDWFGAKVRMDTVVIQARRGPLDPAALVRSMVLSGDLRRKAILGKVPLSQLEARRSRLIPLSRTLNSPTYDIEPFRTGQDDVIMGTMGNRSTALSSLCHRSRGEEMSKTGLLWECPSCMRLTTPGTKRKGGGYNDKNCEGCGHALVDGMARVENVVTEVPQIPGTAVPFIDGDDICARYQRVVTTKWLKIDSARWTLKDPALYIPPKLLLRQAGVGISATLDYTEARCPQSVYIYRLRDEFVAEGYASEFVLAALLSRTMCYFVIKRFAEVDPAKAFAKLTHDRLAELPIPKVDFGDKSARARHDTICRHVKSLLSGQAKLGGAEDLAVEQALRELWGLSATDGAYINGEFFDLPEGQVVRDLFPNGRPLPPIADDVADAPNP